MKMFDKIKGSIKTAQDKAKAMGSSAKASMNKAKDGTKNMGSKVSSSIKKLNPLLFFFSLHKFYGVKIKIFYSFKK